ncbi:hypothetical protein HGRIS_003894 [Hohenbuehelia grisea]|uniref:Peptidase A1 domain-containing protein n=1 Tax=Hohenbuehelia grisea TaxID=104357 RepID=A0ABR3JGV1_9AGAR
MMSIVYASCRRMLPPMSMILWGLCILCAELVLGQSAATSSRGQHQHQHATPQHVALPVQQGSGPNVPLHYPRKRALNGTLAGITSVTLSSDKQAYYALLQAGNISFRVALDTASADLWLTSSACATDACRPLPKYPLTYQSPTFVSISDNATTFNASYADGTVVSGFVARESVTLANITAVNQTFGVITDSNVTLTDQVSGILGLGFPRLSSINSTATNSTPFFVGLAQQGVLDYPLFGLSLTSNSSGTLTLGAIDASVVKNASNITWHPVVQFAPFADESRTASYLQWATPLTAFSVNESQLIPHPTYANITNNQSLALVDIGTAGIYGPFQDVSRLYSLIDGARLVNAVGQWAIPCENAPPIAFTFGDHNFTLSPSDYIIGPAAGNPNLCLTWPRAVPPSSDGIDWQFGATFLRTVYSVFSYGINSKEPPMIGFYPLTHNTTNASLPFGSQVISHLSSVAATTIATTLPNFPLSTPTFTVPPYTFNASVTAAIGGLVSAALATSTYRPLLGGADAGDIDAVNATGIPTISPPPSLVTLMITDMAGSVVVSTSTVVQASPALGVPPGWNAAAKGVDARACGVAALVSLAVASLLSMQALS